MPDATGDVPDSVALFTADRQRSLTIGNDFLRNADVRPETKEDIVTETASAMRQIADHAGFYV